MNRLHRWYCRSGHWSRTLEHKLLPWALGDTNLGQDVLEIGPGPGLVTELLRDRAEKWTAVEIEPEAARRLAKRMAGTNVNVVEGDATALEFDAGRFSGAVSFTMLHHVPSVEAQDRLLSEVHRVLAPGGVFVGTDSLTSRAFELVHAFDTLVPVPPETLGARLERAGFGEVRVEAGPRTMRFRARRA